GRGRSSEHESDKESDPRQQKKSCDERPSHLDSRCGILTLLRLGYAAKERRKPRSYFVAIWPVNNATRCVRLDCFCGRASGPARRTRRCRNTNRNRISGPRGSNAWTAPRPCSRGG